MKVKTGKDRLISLRISSNQYEMLRELSEQRSASMSEIVRQALRPVLQDEKAPARQGMEA